MTEERWTADDAQCEVIKDNVNKAEARRATGGKQAGMSINVTLPNEVYDWLKGYAEECGVSISAMVRALIVAHRMDVENGEEDQ